MYSPPREERPRSSRLRNTSVGTRIVGRTSLTSIWITIRAIATAALGLADSRSSFANHTLRREWGSTDRARPPTTATRSPLSWHRSSAPCDSLACVRLTCSVSWMRFRRAGVDRQPQRRCASALSDAEGSLRRRSKDRPAEPFTVPRDRPAEAHERATEPALAVRVGRILETAVDPYRVPLALAAWCGLRRVKSSGFVGPTWTSMRDTCSSARRLRSSAGRSPSTDPSRATRSDPFP
jgi:hypothetical protein